MLVKLIILLNLGGKMDNQQNEQEEVQLGKDDRLKAILYQYIKLYERWSEDRQIFMKNLSLLDDFSAKFAQQLKEQKDLESHIRNQLVSSIQREVRDVSEGIGEKIKESANLAVEKTANSLKQTVRDATTALENYKSETKASNIKMIALTIGASVLSSLLIAKLLMPAPVEPFARSDFDAFESGLILKGVWQEVPDRTKMELNNLARKKVNRNFPLTADPGGNS
jgi:hypothetical protein